MVWTGTPCNFQVLEFQLAFQLQSLVVFWVFFGIESARLYKYFQAVVRNDSPSFCDFATEVIDLLKKFADTFWGTVRWRYHVMFLNKVDTPFPSTVQHMADSVIPREFSSLCVPGFLDQAAWGEEEFGGQVWEYSVQNQGISECFFAGRSTIIIGVILKPHDVKKYGVSLLLISYVMLQTPELS